MEDKQIDQYTDGADKRPDIQKGLFDLKTMVLDRSHALEADQRALLTMILEQGSSYEQVARLRGEHATTVSRRFRRLMSKLSNRAPEKMAAPTEKLTRMEKTIVSAYYLYGMGQSQIAARLGISRYRVRKALDQIGTPTARSRCIGMPPVTVAAQRRRQSCTR